MTVVFSDMRGAVSGGTVASGFGAFDDPDARRVAADPYCLNPPGGRRAFALVVRRLVLVPAPCYASYCLSANLLGLHLAS